MGSSGAGRARRRQASGPGHASWRDRTQLLAQLKAERFGSWEVIGDAIDDRRIDGNIRPYVLCRCRRTGIVSMVAVCNLLGGKTLGPRGLAHVKHGGGKENKLFYDEAAERLGDRYDAMMQRCEDPTYPRYRDYGGRGIRCKFPTRWLFIQWCRVHLPHPTYRGVQIDRIDNNGHYEPGNLRLSSARMNVRNTRRNRYITYRGVQVIAHDLWHLLKRDVPGFALSSATVGHLVGQGCSVAEILRRKPRSKRSTKLPTEPDPEILALYPKLPPAQRTSPWPRKRSRLAPVPLPQGEASPVVPATELRKNRSAVAEQGAASPADANHGARSATKAATSPLRALNQRATTGSADAHPMDDRPVQLELDLDLDNSGGPSSATI